MAAVPLNEIVLVPWLLPKFEPVIVTARPTAPEVGETLVMLGGWITAKLRALLATPPTVTTRFPLIDPLGIVTTIEFEFQLDTLQIIPLRLTLLSCCVAPKFDPVIVTDVPTTPDAGDKPMMFGETLAAPIE